MAINKLDPNKPLFAEGIFAKKVTTQYGELINLEIEIDTIRRNLTIENDKGREAMYVTIKTSKDGNPYAVINTFKYPNLNKQKEDELPPF